MPVTFETYQYTRPEFDAFSDTFRQSLQRFETARSYEEQDRALSQINELRTEFTSMYNICHIRHTMDTENEFYEKENEFFDQQMPAYEGLINDFYKKLLASPFRPALEQKWGRQLFTIAEFSLK
nr:M3 family oligoendopeptidase [Saprospiraceae bacterium]